MEPNAEMPQGQAVGYNIHADPSIGMPPVPAGALTPAKIPDDVLAGLAPPKNPHINQSAVDAEPKAHDFTFEHYTATNLPSVETARQVADLFVAVYGGIHNRDILKDPEHYRDEVRRGELIPFIVRDVSGKVIAHTAIMALSHRSVEVGLQLSHPGVRGRSFGATLRDRALAHLEHMVAAGIVDTIRAECVTAHAATQKFAHRANFVVTGILDRKFFDMFETNRDETFVRLESIKNPDIRKDRVVYLPGSMYAMADNIFKDLACSRQIMLRPNATDTVPPAGPATVSRETHELTAWDALVLEISPEVTALQIAQEIDREFSNGVKHLTIRVDISHPAAIDQVNALRALGFYFAAIEPVRERDYLLMQRLKTVDGSLCAPGEIHLYDEKARILLNLIRASQLC